MFNYLKSFFVSPSAELSVDEISQILTEEECPQASPDTLSPQQEFNFSTRKGKITAKGNERYVIDGLYEFISEEMDLPIGSTVSYQKLVSNGKIEVYNVTEVSSDWDSVIEKDSIVTTRIMVCKVEKRDKRILFLYPNNIKVDLDKVSVEFIPYVGDWLEVDVQYAVNEETIDLSGDVISVNRLCPMRLHIETGKITGWDPLEESGSINKKIYFEKDSLSCGYIPVVGDKVVAEILESDQGKLQWRALKILPELVGNGVQSLSENLQFQEQHPGLMIKEVKLSFEKIGETAKFNIDITNDSSEAFELCDIKLRLNSQISQLKAPSECVIEPQSTSSLSLSCTAKTMGMSNEFLLFNFKGFSIGRYVNITVGSCKTGEYYQKNGSVNHQNSYKGNKQLVLGQKRSKTNFSAVRIPNYDVPNRLLDVIIKFAGNNNTNLVMEELKGVKRCLFTNLNPMNYEERFHTLLHLDEIANIIHIRQYDQDRACFIPNREFLMLEIENLAERRPSIVIGDKIYARDPTELSDQEYEGNVFKVGAKHVYLKFSQRFHDSYREEDYSIRVMPGRSSYKRQHHAVFLVSRNLGRDWLFPTKISEKSPQVRFVYTDYKTRKNPHELTVADKIQKAREMRMSLECKAPAVSELLKLAREAKASARKPQFIDQDGNTTNSNEKLLQIDWFNDRLNCKQKDAVINILKGVCRPLPYIIFGPPGTGKTVTVIESILQVLRMIPEARLLVTAPSNSAADLIALRLINFGVLKPGDLVRLVSINYACGDNINAKLVPYCATGSMAKEGTADENIMGPNGMMLDCNRSALGRHRITVSTCSSAGILHMMGFPRGHFTHIFVDEAGQAAEPEVMIPISFLDKYEGQVVLAGDPMQLGPVVMSSIARDCGLTESYLERLINRFPYARDIQSFPDSEGYDHRLVTKLLHNYRSLPLILNLFSDMFYHGELIPTISDCDSTEAKLLVSLESILPKTASGKTPSMVFHGVQGQNYQTADSPSWYNPHEAAQVFYYVNEFVRLGLKAENVGIITPYSKQVREIRQLLKEAEFEVPKVGTVEDFQGQEYDVIVLSTVRSSNDQVSSDLQHSLGFVSSPRRLNVAISRPKCLLLIIGNPNVLSKDTYWRTAINYCAQHGAYTGYYINK